MNDTTEIIMIIDRSGSMHGFEHDTLGGYNAFIEKQQELPGRANLTTILFSDSTTTIEDNVDLQDAKKLTVEGYRSAYDNLSATAMAYRTADANS